MESKNIEANNPEHNTQSGKNSSFFKLMIIFIAVMAALLIGLNYLLKHLF